jgi:O-methyltransferase
MSTPLSLYNTMVTFFVKAMKYTFGNLLRKNKILLGNSLNYLERTPTIDNNYVDTVRLCTLELLSYEINKKNLTGNVAELGVYKGKFAKYINQYFPNRILYLFDTFNGFDSRDAAKEMKENFSTANQDFSNTSIDRVLKIMPHPQQCKPIAGFFPTSANTITDPFVLVSIDTDLYDPIYSGLCFFYPKLVKGGYLLVHDFNNDAYKGSRKAVEQFCTEQGIGYTPIADACGTVIIAK